MDISADALLFDMDGTLIDSTPSVRRCWRTWAAEYGLGEEAAAGILQHGRPAAEIIADALPAERLADGGAERALRRIEDLECADTAGTVPLPGSLELLTSLPADRWAVVTSATGRLAAARLEVTGIRPSLLISADDITRGKPDPEPFLRGAEKLGADPARCLVLEDAPAGLAAARAAGMRSVALTTTHRAAELAEHGPEAILDSLAWLRVVPQPSGALLVHIAE
ncbi:HAD-IA family hydrolase [Phaeacidiphilus oryzae]|uniref:HAD-IA family hydrolase n=1 Tax=Phaeacidiphilus oryzae TaxID=348818 RepID=UPI000566E3A0|nr:HAD-IA family hydrolase [Phaeacidiphilus oryzae]